MTSADDSDDDWDEFMDKFTKERYKGGFSEDNWEEEMEKIPLFMTKAPDEIDPKTHPQLACLQALIHDEDRTPEEKAVSLKNEGNAYFQEKNYEKAVVAYTEGLKVNWEDQVNNTVLLTNRAAAQYYLGNMRSALKDSCAALKIKPDHLKALIRGAQCCIEIRSFPEAIRWCDRGLKMHPSDKKLTELRSAADKHKREAERDARKAIAKEKKEQSERERLLAAITERGIKLRLPKRPSGRGSDSEDEEQGAGRALDQVTQDATGARVFLDQEGALHWPVLLLYPEHQQSDFISSFCEASCFIDHLAVMFGEELPSWDTDRKYLPQNLQLFFEDEEKEALYEVVPDMSLLKVLQHKRYFVKAGSPSFIVLVKGSAFSKRTSPPASILRHKEKLQQEVEELLGTDGVLLYPTHPNVAPKHHHPLFRPFDFAYTGIINILGLPVTQVPLGLSREGLPMGVQLIAGKMQDCLPLALAIHLEKSFGGWRDPGAK